jgi:hypothetical protein
VSTLVFNNKQKQDRSKQQTANSKQQTKTQNPAPSLQEMMIIMKLHCAVLIRRCSHTGGQNE